MHTELLDLVCPERERDELTAHILVVVKDMRDRQSIVSQLQDAECRVTTAASYGLVEILLEQAEAFDLLITAQSFGEMAQFGLPQLARSVDADLPIVVLETDAVHGQGVVAAVRSALQRWPVRDRPARQLH